MKLWKDKVSSQSQISALFLWWIPASFPLLLVFSFLLFGKWSWGLMDDYNMLVVPGTVWERFAWLSDAEGRFYPVFLFHTALFYKIFQNNPHAFFFFRFMETCTALALWGYLAYAISGKKTAAALFFAISLSFYKFYDAFFFLSTQEILGILFLGAGLICILKSIKPLFLNTKDSHFIKPIPLVLGGIFLSLTFASKEPFVCSGMALGLSLIVLFLKKENRTRKQLLTIGIVILFLSIAYALYLKMFVAKGYTGNYSLTAWEKIGTHASQWFKKILLNHSPWIVLLVGLLFQRSKVSLPALQIWGGLLGVLLYVFYMLFILPWSGWGHYVTPLGVFFAFALAMFLTPKIEALRPAVLCGVILISLLLNVYVGSKAAYAHATYQYDTANLLRWMSANALFKHDILSQGKIVRCNANEPCTAIPKLANILHQTNFEIFLYTQQVRDILKDPHTKYYIWGPQWGDQDLGRLGSMWSPMFISDNWIVFRRMY